MLDLAKHIIATKAGEFDPCDFHDRYDAALSALVKAKLEGRSLPKRKAPVASRPNYLLQALRMSAGVGSGKTPTAANANAGARRQKSVARSSETATPRRRAS